MRQTRQPPSIFFSSVSDPRVERTRKHSLEPILFISLYAVICGAESWNEIEDYGNDKIDWRKKFPHLPNGIPTHDTFNRVISVLGPKELNHSFVKRTKSIAELTEGEVVSIDGKCLRESSDDGTGAYTHLVSAWASANNIYHGREEKRACSVITDFENILDKDRLAGLRSIIRLESSAKYIKKGTILKKAKVTSMGVKGHRKKAW